MNTINNAITVRRLCYGASDPKRRVSALVKDESKTFYIVKEICVQCPLFMLQFDPTIVFSMKLFI